MDLLYRALGMAAAANSALWRRRINFVPLNLVLVAVVGVLFVANAEGWIESVRNGREPATMPLASLGNRPEATTFVRVSGMLAVGAGFQYGEEDGQGGLKKVTMEFVPLVDAASRHGVFVQLDMPHAYTAPVERAELTGMLREMRPFLSRELEPSNFEYEGIAMLPRFVLVPGETPGNPLSWQIGTATTGAILLLFFFLTLKRNVIFRRRAVPDPGTLRHGGATGTLVRATGTFTLDKHTRRFIDVPAIVGTLDTGELAVLANIDASSNFMGVTYAKREGIWVLPIARASIQDVEEGTLYFGRSAQPAVRFSYRDGVSQKNRVAILTTPTGSAHALAAGLVAGIAIRE